MSVRNYSALAPMPVYLQRRYIEYIVLWWYIITSPSHLQKRRYSGNVEYILWRCSNFFAIALTRNERWRAYGVQTKETSLQLHKGHVGDQKNGGDQMLAGWGQMKKLWVSNKNNWVCAAGSNSGCTYSHTKIEQYFANLIARNKHVAF